MRTPYRVMVVVVEPRRHQSVFLPVCFFSLSGSPRRQRATACRKSPGGQTQAAAQEEEEEEENNGLPSLDTEVWSWGRGSEGQLGHGDQLDRSGYKSKPVEADISFDLTPTQKCA